MKNHIVFSAFILLFSVSLSNISYPVHPLEFRAPYSLTEIMHDGFVEIRNMLDSVANCVSCQDVEKSLQDSAQVLRSMIGQYATLANSSNMHAIHRSEKDFLQGMIDRIDQMIEALEAKRSLTPAQRQLVDDNVELLKELRGKFSA